jgi:hypothetical protein
LEIYNVKALQNNSVIDFSPVILVFLNFQKRKMKNLSEKEKNYL